MSNQVEHADCKEDDLDCGSLGKVPTDDIIGETNCNQTAWL